jgi:hypothetical protein
MTSQAPCGCVDNILITYDENKAKADIPTVLIIYMSHKYNKTAAYKKKKFFLFSKPEKFKAYQMNT